ncbi:MAG: hypothetical protein KAU50_00125 [Candidatus Marinimicrobia bacterium]|nr:hypothetical protein [Candidatus Neomarinimicrobiota bacterium]
MQKLAELIRFLLNIEKNESLRGAEMQKIYFAISLVVILGVMRNKANG